MIKAVIFDIDGVIVDSREANTVLYQDILEKAGYPRPSKEDVLDHFHVPLKATIASLAETKDQAEIDRIAEFVHEPEMRKGHLYIFPGKLEHVLEELQQNYKLAVVTSRIRLGVDHVFDEKEISHFFESVIAFEDYDNPKPHPEPLEKAIDQLKIKAEEAIYIGDSHTDIDAAEAIGMHSIHLSDDPHDKASVVIKDFSEIPVAIKSTEKLKRGQSK